MTDAKVENTCFSGGAEGADTLFGVLAEAAGHNVVHYHFRPNKAKQKNVKVLSEFHLIQSDPYLIDANKYIKRKFPTRSLDVDNLLRRNYYQIEASQRIYAATTIGDNGIPLGGTAWAVMMGILKGINEVYVYDQAYSAWCKFKGYDKSKKLVKWTKATGIPAPEGLYTGIGSRALTEDAVAAIHRLYA